MIILIKVKKYCPALVSLENKPLGKGSHFSRVRSWHFLHLPTLTVFVRRRTIMMKRLVMLLAPLLVVSMNPQSRDIRIINEAGFKVEIFWINRWKNDELVLNSDEGIFHGAESQINSYVTHEFEVHEIPNKKLGKCKGPDDTCRKGYFQVNDNDEQCK